MSSYDKVNKAPKDMFLPNALFESMIAVRTIKATSTGPQLATPVKRRSFRLANNISYPKTSIENNSQKNKCTGDATSTTNSAVERKMRRKSFFERICGNKGQQSNAETPIKITSPQTNRFALSSEDQNATSNSESQSKKKSVTKVCNGIVYGSTSTVDSSSCLSIELKNRSTLEAQKKAFACLNIKKAKLTKNTNSEPTFIPLVGCLVEDSEAQQEAHTFEKRFQNSKFANDYADLAEDIEEWDGQWAEIDDKALTMVFSKGKY